LSKWDVSKVTRMDGMFRKATNFDSDISSWDVSCVTKMSEMFRGARSFNQDLSSWKISNVERMPKLFAGASSFDQDLCAWSSRMDNGAQVKGMFTATSCGTWADPDVSRGPFCHTCSAASADDGGTNTAAFEPQGQSSFKQDSIPTSWDWGDDEPWEESNESLESNEWHFMAVGVAGVALVVAAAMNRSKDGVQQAHMQQRQYQDNAALGSSNMEMSSYKPVSIDSGGYQV
jgi:surface protein